MRFIYKLPYLIGAGLSLLLLVGCALLSPSGTISIDEFSGFKNAMSQADIDERPSLEIRAFVTGWVKAPANILIVQDSPLLPPDLQKAQWVPSIAYAVKHPKLGVVIFDTGLRAGECDYGLRPIYWVPCYNKAGQDLVSHLKQAGIKPHAIRYIIPSHFHGDHISGLENLLSYTQAPLLVTAEALQDLRSPMGFAKGIPSSMLSTDMHVEIIDTHWRKDNKLVESFDLFGDGSLKIFKTPGHMDGHISALVKTGNQATLLTFDAAHLQANFDLTLPSGAVTSQKMAIKSLEMIQHLSEASPEMHVIFGHEPSQWTCSKQSDSKPLNILGGNCVHLPEATELIKNEKGAD